MQKNFDSSIFFDIAPPEKKKKNIDHKEFYLFSAEKHFFFCFHLLSQNFSHSFIIRWLKVSVVESQSLLMFFIFSYWLERLYSCLNKRIQISFSLCISQSRVPKLNNYKKHTVCGTAEY